MAILFDRILPPDVSPLLQGYFFDSPHSTRSSHGLIAAFIVSLSAPPASSPPLWKAFGARTISPSTVGRSGNAASGLPPGSSFLIPFAVASIIRVFGQFVTAWLALHIMPSARTPVYLVALLLRWCIALTGSIGIVGLIYHMGTPMQQSWKRVLPGAVVSTVMWFLTTLVFGWYVTRFANYSQVYGSLAPASRSSSGSIIISLCVLYGAEFNTEFHARYFHSQRTHSTPRPQTTSRPVRIASAVKTQWSCHP